MVGSAGKCRQRKLFEVAWTLVPTIKTKFKERKQEIEAKRDKALLKKQKEIVRKQHQVVQEKEIEVPGLWTSTAEIKSRLQTYSKKADKVKVL